MKKQGKQRKMFAVVMALLLTVAIIQPGTVKAARGYCMKYGSTTVTPGTNASTILKKAGKANSTTKRNSCATSGYDYTRKYDDFTLCTYTTSKRKNATEYVSSIILKTDKVKTSEGLKVGSSESTVKRKYRGAKENFGVYSKTKGQTKINITVSNGKVTEIEILKK